MAVASSIHRSDDMAVSHAVLMLGLARGASAANSVKSRAPSVGYPCIEATLPSCDRSN